MRSPPAADCRGPWVRASSGSSFSSGGRRPAASISAVCLSRRWQSRGQKEMGATLTSQMTFCVSIQVSVRWFTASQTPGKRPRQSRSGRSDEIGWRLWGSCLLGCRQGARSCCTWSQLRPRCDRGSLVPRRDGPCQAINGPRVKSRTSGRCRWGVWIIHVCCGITGVSWNLLRARQPQLWSCDPNCPRRPVRSITTGQDRTWVLASKLDFSTGLIGIGSSSESVIFNLVKEHTHTRADGGVSSLINSLTSPWEAMGGLCCRSIISRPHTFDTS